MVPLTPHIQLIFFLDKHFPRVNPHPSDSHADIMYESGKRYVVDYLMVELEKQQEEDPVKTRVLT